MEMLLLENAIVQEQEKAFQIQIERPHLRCQHWTGTLFAANRITSMTFGRKELDLKRLCMTKLKD
jgi:hypothetical protein